MDRVLTLTYDQLLLCIGMAVELFAALILIVLIISSLTDPDKEDHILCDRLIFEMMGCEVVMLVSDMIAKYLRLNLYIGTPYHILAFVVFAANNITTLLYACYLCAYMGRESKADFKPVNPFFLLILVALVYWIVSFNMGTLYHIDETTHAFIYDKTRWIVHLPGIIVMLFNTVYTIANRTKLSRHDSIILLLYGFVPPALLPLEVIMGSLPIYLGMAFSTVMIYIMVHEERNKLDIEQSRELMRHRAELANNRSRLALSQIRPHFLYNSLNTIYYLCDNDPKTAQKALASLSDYLRMNLDALGKEEFVMFEVELKHIETYLSLEKLRFEDELSIEYDIGATNFCVPVLSIQPIVENAVKHGVGPKIGGGTVRISSREKADYYEIIVEDDGMGFDVNAPKRDDGRTHVGVESVRQRIDTMCEGQMIIDSKIDVGTRVTVRLPKDLSKDNVDREMKI